MRQGVSFRAVTWLKVVPLGRLAGKTRLVAGFRVPQTARLNGDIFRQNY